MMAITWRRLGSLMMMMMAIVFFGIAEGAWRGKKSDANSEHLQATNDGAPESLGLVQVAGTYLWKYLRTYRLSIRLITGYTLDEYTTVWTLSATCNVIYCLLMLAGFVFVPRNIMLVVGLLTATIGPALVLVILGLLLGCFAAMALYPICTVMALWTFFFLQSQFFQTVGILIGLDVNGDGHVDFWDWIDFLGRTRLGKALGVASLHSFGKRLASNGSLLDQLDARFERIERRTVEAIEKALSDRRDRERRHHSSWNGLGLQQLLGASPPAASGKLPEDQGMRVRTGRASPEDTR